MFQPSEPPEGITINGRRSFEVYFGELKRLGYIEGQNLIVERYSALGHTERYGDIARAIVASHPDLIISFASLIAQVLKPLTATIPILTTSADPVARGIVTSLAKPEANITGVSDDVGMEVWGKRLQLLRETVGKLTNVRVLIAPTSVQFWEMALQPSIREPAQRVGISLAAALVPEPLDGKAYERVFDTMATEKVDGLIVMDATEFLTVRQLVVDVVARYRLPAIYFFREFVEVGGLLAYGANILDIVRRLAAMTDQVLRGAKPGDVPFYQPTKLELVLNRTTARLLGLEFPPSLLAIADEVIG